MMGTLSGGEKKQFCDFMKAILFEQIWTLLNLAVDFVWGLGKQFTGHIYII